MKPLQGYRMRLDDVIKRMPAFCHTLLPNMASMFAVCTNFSPHTLVVLFSPLADVFFK